MSSVDQMTRGLKVFTALDDNLPHQYILVYLRVAEAVEIEVRDLVPIAAHEFAMSPSALNRALRYLSDEHWSKTKPGLGLIDQRIHPADRRVRIASLTPRGRMILEQLEAAVGT